ncbi:hypothetical protein [Cytobacillus massiliigabonensis]|uniref:hypothetical protein n=1 Tax=Cytobacillus massiliigabonensis TaxID=1871011 RepID=UPI000C8661D1|nr:hypothetical protein [Cytobacillus massiliigabonensis]
MSKTPVKFSPFMFKEKLTNRLYVCKNCSGYTLLHMEHCSHCSQAKGYFTMEQFISKKYRLTFQSDIFLLLFLLFIAVFFTFHLSSIVIIGTIGAAAIIFFSIFKLLMRSSEKKHFLMNQVIADREKIKRGIQVNKKFAEKKVQNSAYLEAYEILRIIGLFWNDDSIKELKLICLNTFIIRKDMQLEMDTVVPNRYSKEFITYLGSAAKVQRHLVNKKILDYVVTYERQIQEHFSNEIFITVAGSALRMKQYFLIYEDFIMKYVDEMPRERVIRLYQLLESINSYEIGESKKRAHQLLLSKFNEDPFAAALH